MMNNAAAATQAQSFDFDQHPRESRQTHEVAEVNTIGAPGFEVQPAPGIGPTDEVSEQKESEESRAEPRSLGLPVIYVPAPPVATLPNTQTQRSKLCNLLNRAVCAELKPANAQQQLAHLASNKQQPLVPTSDECHEGISTQVQEANDTGSEHSDGIGQCYESDDKGWTDEEVDQHRIQEPNPEIVIIETLLADAARGSATPGWLERRLAAHQRTLTQRLRRAVLIARAADEVHAIRNPGGERAPMNESEAETALARRVKYLLGDEQIDSTSTAAVEAAIGVPAGTVFLLQAKQRCVLERKHAQKARQRDIESRRSLETEKRNSRRQQERERHDKAAARRGAAQVEAAERRLVRSLGHAARAASKADRRRERLQMRLMSMSATKGTVRDPSLARLHTTGRVLSAGKQVLEEEAHAQRQKEREARVARRQRTAWAAAAVATHAAMDSAASSIGKVQHNNTAPRNQQALPERQRPRPAWNSSPRISSSKKAKANPGSAPAVDGTVATAAASAMVSLTSVSSTMGHNVVEATAAAAAMTHCAETPSRNQSLRSLKSPETEATVLRASQAALRALKHAEKQAKLAAAAAEAETQKQSRRVRTRRSSPEKPPDPNRDRAFAPGRIAAVSRTPPQKSQPSPVTPAVRTPASPLNKQDVTPGHFSTPDDNRNRDVAVGSPSAKPATPWGRQLLGRRHGRFSSRDSYLSHVPGTPQELKLRKERQVSALARKAREDRRAGLKERADLREVQAAEQEILEQARREAQRKARRKAEEQARRKAEELARREAEKQAQRDAQEHAQREAAKKAQHEAEEQARAEAWKLREGPALMRLQRSCKMYLAKKRARAMRAVSLELMAQTQRFRRLLLGGVEVLKFPRKGAPSNRTLWLHTDANLYLTDDKARRKVESGSGSNSMKHIPLCDLTTVTEGAAAAPFLRSSKAAKHVKGQEATCMSIIGNPGQPEFHFRVETAQACQMLASKLRGLIAQINGPRESPRAREERIEAAREFTVANEQPMIRR